MKRIVSFILVLALSCCVLTGCGGDFSVTCHIGDYPLSLDPQMASTQVEIIITGNAFEGLMRFDENGKPIPAASESYTVSDDGLVYTFTLRKDLKWSNGETLSAEDFIFGLERATLSSTKAPFGYLLKAIVGAEERLSGKNTPLSVKNEGGKIIIKLKEKSDAFLSALCHPVASPCKEDFFEKSGGKYGIGAKNIISNGLYKIAYTLSDSLIRISKNANYHNALTTDCSSVEFKFNDIKKDENFTDKLIKNSWDIAVSDNDSAQKAVNSGMKVINRYTSAYYLLFNQRATVCKNQDLRNAYTLSMGEIKTNKFTPLKKLLPNDVTVNGTAAGSIEGLLNYNYSYSPDTARSLFLKYSSSIANVNGVGVLCEENEDVLNVLRPIVSSWQKNLGAYFNISTVSKNQIENKLQDSSFAIMLAEIDSGDSSSLSLVKNIYSALGSPTNLKSAYEKCLKATTVESSTIALNEFLDALYNGSYAVPVMTVPKTIVHNEDLENVLVNSYGGIDFSFIKK